MKEEIIGKWILDHVCNTISKSAHHKGGPCLQLHFYKNLIFSKKELTGNKVTKEGNVGRRILDHVCNPISKSAHHKGGPCLQLHLYKNLIFSNNELSWNKVMI